MRIEVQGLYKLWVERGGVVTQETPWFDNLITDNGMDLIGTGYSRNCYVGHGTADARYDDVSLGGYVAGLGELSGLDRDRTGETPPYRSYMTTFRSGIGSIAGPISEVGIGPAWNNLVSRAVLPNALLLDGDVDRLYVVWEFRQCIPTENYEFDVEIAGAMRACVAYPTNTESSSTFGVVNSGWNILPGERLFNWSSSHESSNLIRVNGGWTNGGENPMIGGTDSYARRRSYVPGSHKLTFDIHYGPGITGAIDAAQFGQGRDSGGSRRGNGGIWQVDISPSIALEDHQRFHMVFDLSWARCGSSSDGMGDPGTPHIAGEVYPEPEPEPDIGPAVWLDAADALMITADASNGVTEWLDKGSQELVFEGGSNGRPIYTENQQNGKSALVFDGGQALFTRDPSLASSVGALTVFHVFKHIGGSDFNIFRVTNSLYKGHVRNGAGMTALGYRRLDSDSYTNVSYGLPDSSGLTITAHTTDYANGQAYVGRNGGPFTNYTSLGSSGLTDSALSLRIYIGASYGTAWAQEIEGDLCEIIAFQRVLSNQERQQIEGYLAHKWGLETNLPADHPHKATSPGVPDYFPVIDPSTWVTTVTAPFQPTGTLVFGVIIDGGAYNELFRWDHEGYALFDKTTVINAINAETANTYIEASDAGDTADGYGLTLTLIEAAPVPTEVDVSVGQHENRGTEAEPSWLFVADRYYLHKT